MAVSDKCKSKTPKGKMTMLANNFTDRPEGLSLQGGGFFAALRMTNGVGYMLSGAVMPIRCSVLARTIWAALTNLSRARVSS